jgi:hypothetical protein
MALSDLVNLIADYKARLTAWEGNERARARQIGRDLAIERQRLITRAAEHGASARAVAKELLKPQIGPELSPDRDEGSPSVETAGSLSLLTGGGLPS